MAVLQMKRISICALKKNRKKLMEHLQRSEVIEISDTLPEDSVFHKVDVSKTEDALKKNQDIAQEALRLLQYYSEKKQSLLSVLDGKRDISLKEYENFQEEYEKTLSIARSILQCEKEIVDAKSDILKMEAQIKANEPWIDLDLPIQIKETNETRVFIGTLTNEWTVKQIHSQLEHLLFVHIEMISVSKDQTCVFVLCFKKEEDAVFDALRAISFTPKNLEYKDTPKEETKLLTMKRDAAKKLIDVSKEMIQSYAVNYRKLQLLFDYESTRLEKYHAIGRILQSNKVMFFSGFVPQNQSAKLKENLEQKFDAVVDLEATKDSDDVPVLLKNNGFSAPLESTVEGFSLPGKGEADPTFVMSLFYYMLFGLMLSDAAYGAIMVLVCGIALCRFQNMEESMKRTMRLYLFCGISTIFWGVMFGSYFGDVVDVVSETFFHHKVSIPPLWFIPVNEPMRMLVFSMLLGVIHLYAGLAMKLYQNVKAKQYKDAVYDVVFWYILLTSCIFLLLSTEMFVGIVGISFILPPVIAKISAVLAVVSVVGILITAGRESKQPFKRFLKGLYGLYGISGYLSDVLSYSRLLALGLATGVICTVINKMGAMAGDGIFGVIVFTVVFIMGHLLNIGINALGAYVHTNRLQYVEFFGKFYDGGGKKFVPFSTKTKYYKIKENTSNG